MAYIVELSRRAELDLRRIFQFIHASESQAAARWFDELQQQIESLSSLPNRSTITGYDAKLRYLHFGNKPHLYRILYRIDPTSRRVVIRHIRHGARMPLG